jgi:hypothetical protein
MSDWPDDDDPAISEGCTCGHPYHEGACPVEDTDSGQPNPCDCPEFESQWQADMDRATGKD